MRLLGFFLSFLLFTGCLTSEAQSRSTARPVYLTVEFAMVPPPSHPDAILYSWNRPLYLDDFRGIPNDPQAVAATYSSLGMGYRATTRNGQTTLNVTITTYMDPNESWCRPNARTRRVLDHEQLHFDITALAACSLRDAILAASLTSSNYKAELARIQQEYNDWWRTKEEQYDNETVHGTDYERQREWAQSIRAQVELQPCFQDQTADSRF
jgi:hypothetical protein